MPTTRRQFMALTATALSCTASAAASAPRSSLGIVEYSMGVHRKIWRDQRKADLSDPMVFLEEARNLGAGGIQISMGRFDEARLSGVRAAAERHGMFVEANITPPFDSAEVADFERRVLSAKAAGAALARTVIMPGRRYEEFKSLADYQDCAVRGEKALGLAEPVLARHRFKLAVENHKDHRCAERVAMLRRLGSEWIGACLDVGNNLALLEDPLQVVAALAPFAMTVHIKDHAVRECEDGFLIFDTALGQGILDLPAIVAAIRKVRPEVRFGLESITRDAIRVPVLADSYWRTFPEIPATDLARTLRLVRSRSSPAPLPTISALPPDRQLAAERATITQSLRYASETLGL